MPPRETRFQRMRRQRGVAGDWDEDELGDVIGADPDPAAEIKELEASIKKLAEEIDKTQRSTQDAQTKAAELVKSQQKVAKLHEQTEKLQEQTRRTQQKTSETIARTYETQRQTATQWEGMFWVALVGAGLYALQQEKKPRRRRR